MKTHRTNRTLPLIAGLGFAALLAVGCSSDSPSEPQQNPQPPSGGGASAFNISVTSSQPTIPAGAEQPAQITVSVQRRDSNGNNVGPPTNGTTLVLSTSLGDFITRGSGTRSVILTLVGGIAQVNLFAGNTQGTAVLQAVLENAVGRTSVSIEGAATFFLSFARPSTGEPAGGDIVEIHGGGFADPVRVTFGAVVAEVLSFSPTVLTVRTPPSLEQVNPGTTVPVNIGVTINLNEATQDTDTLANGFAYVRGGVPPTQPLIFSVSPASGVNEGGTRVTITGTGFVAPVQVLFGQGANANSFTGVEATIESVTSSQIVVRSPAATGFGQANQNRQVNILERNLSTGLTAVTANAFRYGTGMIITSVEPDQIVFDSRATVRIHGQGFEAPVTVNLAGIQADVISVTGTEIQVRAPVPLITNCEDVVNPIQVINVNSGSSDSTDDSNGPQIADFRYRVPKPIITSVIPSSGTGNGGTNVLISGAGFDDPVRVLFGTASGNVLSVNASGTAINVLTPQFTDFSEEPCDDLPGGETGLRFKRETVDVEVRNQLTGCNDTFEGGFTFIPADLTCRGDTAEPPPATQCTDGFDNDGDTFIDAADPQCTGPTDNSESS